MKLLSEDGRIATHPINFVEAVHVELPYEAREL